VNNTDASAPGPLGFVEAFVNTDSAEGDLLGDRPAAVGWFRARGMLPTDPVVVSVSEHAALLRLRDSLRAVLVARTEGHLDHEAAGSLTRGLAGGRLVLTVDPAGAAHLATAARAPYPSMVAAVAIAIAGSVTAGTWSRLKIRKDSGLAWYDESAVTS
jgi:hypothetical protein